MSKKIEHILLATDFSDTSNDAVAYAKWMHEQLGAKLTLLHVFDPSALYMPAPYYFMSGSEQWINEHIETIRAKGSEALDNLAGEFEEGVEQSFVEGKPGPEIVRAAAENNADLIIMGSHGYSGWNRLVLGSIAEYVLRHASCGVLTVKPGNPSD